MRGISSFAGCLLLFGGAPGTAQDPAERTRMLCDPGRFSTCPGSACPCVETSLEITFDGDTDSVFQYESFAAGTVVDTRVVLNVKDAEIQGWSYGVAHDPAYLLLQDVNTRGTAAEAAMEGGFVVADRADIESCEHEPAPDCRQPRPGNGFISAVILSFTRKLELPLGPQVVCNATYELTADAGSRGTLIQPTNRLKKRGSPPADINLSTGISRQPNHLVHGWVKWIGEPAPADSRSWCNPEDDDRCPGPRCPCLPNTLAFRFETTGTSTHEYETFTQDAPVEAAVFLDAQIPGVQGWSFGVDHDGDYLTIESVTVDGTAAEVAKDGGFVVATSDIVETCAASRDPACQIEDPGSGFVTAVILSYRERIELPIGAHRVVRATYALKADPGPNGTRLNLATHVAVRNSPAANINIAVDGVSTDPQYLVDGWLKRAGEPIVEICDDGVDDDQDGKVDCADRDCSTHQSCLPPPEACDNGIDDDRDGAADCQDVDCINAEPCRPRPEVCDNGADDDGDGRTDCDDRDCVEFPRCIRESCLNGIDDDQDGATDCADSECEEAIICRPEVCDNDVDDNANAMTDCYDPECKEFPACEPRPEICDNGGDEDFDAKFDCADPDCKEFDPCVPRPEICDNRRDDDLDGRTDCRDRDCADAAACAPGPEVCDDCFDNDRDGRMDCADQDCAAHPHCSPQPEVCDNGIDDDDDGLIDGGDGDCTTEVLAALGVCPDYAVFFGPTSTSDDHRADGGGFVIALGNRLPVLAFRLCVRRDVAGDAAVYSVTSGWLLNEFGSRQIPVAANRALGAAGAVVSHAERAGATAELWGWDFLSSQTSADGDACLTVDYVVDLNPSWPRGVIPATRPRQDCDVNEVLRVVTVPSGPRFRRGELDGAGGLGIADAILIIRWLTAAEAPHHDCLEAMDVNDDGRIGITDPIVALRYLFQEGPAPAPPFADCGLDPGVETDGLGCTRPNCR